MKGQTLIETVLALGIIAIILSGVTIVVTSSLSDASFSQNQTLATQYAQEGTEILRTIRSSDYAGFNKNGTYCLAKGALTLPSSSPSCTAPNVDSFIRSVSIVKDGCSAKVAQTTVTVSWSDNKCSSGSYCHSSNLISCLSTISPIQAP